MSETHPGHEVWAGGFGVPSAGARCVVAAGGGVDDEDYIGALMRGAEDAHRGEGGEGRRR